MSEDIVDLKIQAENLASEELVRAADDVEGLGEKAEKSQVRVEKLEITNRTIDSFREASKRVNDLTEELAKAENEFINYREEIKKSGGATDDQRANLIRLENNSKALRKELNLANNEFQRQSSSLRVAGVETKNLEDAQRKLNQELDEARVVAKRQNDELQKRTSTLKEQIAIQQRVVDEQQKEAAAQEKLTREIEEQTRSRLEATRAAEKEEETNKQLALSLKNYERELEKLNNEKEQGNVSTRQYIKGEQKLRREMKLTSTQVAASRKAIEADAAAKTRAAKASTSLATVTTRLAGAYGVLLSAQQAVQAALGSTREYGQFQTTLINIEKTTGLAAEQVKELGNQFQELSTEFTPTAANELSRIAEVVGQLGVTGTKDIEKLVRVFDQLSVSTNLSADEAAIALTRILQLTGEGVGNVDRLGASLVELGNNFAVNEAEITKFASELTTTTRQMNLNSASVFGLATALAEAGILAESSRTAMGRFGETIQRAVKLGGEELEELSNITGLAGEEIQKLFGTESEKILIAFAKGLTELKDGTTTAALELEKFGLTGTEVIRVADVLANRSERLTEAISASSDAYRDNQALIDEAAKFYARQEASVDRLRNKFTELQVSIGEAFSDELSVAISRISEGIGGVEQDIIELAEILPDALSGVSEILSDIDNLLSSLSDNSLVDVLSEGTDRLAVAFNAIQILLNGLALSINEIKISAIEAFNEIDKFFGGEPNTERLDKLRATSQEIAASIQRDVGDITNAYDRLANDTPRILQDLIGLTEKERDVVRELTDAQRDQIATLITKKDLSDDELTQVRELTAAIVRRKDELAIAAQLEKQRTEEAEKALRVDERLVQVNESIRNSIANKNLTTETQNSLLNEAQETVSGLLDQLNKQLITEDQLQQKLQATALAYEARANSLASVVQASESEARSYEEIRGNLNALIVNYQTGRLTAEEFAQSKRALVDELNSATSAFDVNAQTIGSATQEQLKLRVEIDKTEASVKELTRQLKDATLAEEKRAAVVAKLSSEQQKLNALRGEEGRLNEINNASYFELQRQQETAVNQLELLETRYQSGIISTGEYIEKKRELQAVLSELGAAIGANTEEITRNNQAQEAATSAIKTQGETAKTASKYTNLYAQAYNYLNRQFDFTSTSASDLSSRVRELEGKILQAGRVTSQWWKELANVNREGFEREKQIINETLALRKYLDIVNSGNASLSQLNQIAFRVNNEFRQLGENQLEPLRNAIRAAKQELQSLNDEINDSLDEALDRLDEVRGNQEAIIKRRYEREQQELEALIAKARESGSQAAVDTATEALRKTIEAQRLEFQQFTQQNTPQQPNTQNNSQLVPVIINLPSGEEVRVNVGSQSDVEALLGLIENARSVAGGA